MAIQVILSADTIKNVLVETIEMLFGIPPAELRSKVNSPLLPLSQDVMRQIMSDVISDHPLHNIVQFALSDIVSHCEAIDALMANKASLLHVRHIEEIFTVLKYIINSPGRYNEIFWRWNNFAVVDKIRNRILNVKTPIDNSMQKWIESNMFYLKTYIDKRFTEDCNQCVKSWDKYNNWLYPISLKVIFDDTGRNNSYSSSEYNWNSHVVHFSPLADEYINYELEYFTYREFAVDSIIRYLNAFCRECLAVVVNREALRRFHAMNVCIDIYRLIDCKPKRYIAMANKGGRFALFTEFLLNGNHTLEAVIDVVLGEEPIDPLSILHG